MWEDGFDDNGDRVGRGANVCEFDCGWVCEQGSGLHAPFITIRIGLYSWKVLRQELINSGDMTNRQCRNSPFNHTDYLKSNEP
jgi:hypothetical protein